MLTKSVCFVIALVFAVYYSGKGRDISRKFHEIVHGKPGCVPVDHFDAATLQYFAGRGRAEAIRLILKEARIPFTEKNVNKDTWPEQKKKGTESGFLTFGQVPSLETSSGVRLVQSHVIVHYIGRATGMDCDCEDVYLCDVIANGVEDARSKMTKMYYDPRFSLADREEYLSQTAPLWLGYFEKLAPPLSSQGNAFFASGRLTWVDILVFDLVDNNLEFAKYDVGTPNVLSVDVLAKFPKLRNFYQSMAKRPNLAAHLNSKERFPYKIPNLPKGIQSSKE